jgi:hypothetical protein
MYILTYFILCTELHVALMQTNFCRNWRHHIKGCAILFWSFFAWEKRIFTKRYFITFLWQWCLILGLSDYIFSTDLSSYIDTLHTVSGLWRYYCKSHISKNFFRIFYLVLTVILNYQPNIYENILWHLNILINVTRFEPQLQYLIFTSDCIIVSV